MSYYCWTRVLLPNVKYRNINLRESSYPVRSIHPYLVLDQVPRVGRRYSVIEAAILKKWDFEDFDLGRAHQGLYRDQKTNKVIKQSKVFNHTLPFSISSIHFTE